MSQAAIRMERSFWRRKKASLERLVDLPTPLTPTMEITYGLGLLRESVAGSLAVEIARRRSSVEVGVRILARAEVIACLIAAFMPGFLLIFKCTRE